MFGKAPLTSREAMMRSQTCSPRQDFLWTQPQLRIHALIVVTNRSTKCGKPRLTLHCVTDRRPHLAESVQHIFVGHLRPAVLLVPVGLGICHIDSQPRTNCGKPGGQKFWVPVRGQLSGNVKKTFPGVQQNFCRLLPCQSLETDRLPNHVSTEPVSAEQYTIPRGTLIINYR